MALEDTLVVVPARLFREPDVAPESMETMRRRGGTWAAYRNEYLGHPDLGHLTFLQYGPTCTFKTPPTRMPDSPQMIGWRYQLVGTVDLTP